jgi:hypothetical protein
VLQIHKLMFTAILASVILSSCATEGQEPVDEAQPVSQIRSAKELDIYLQTTPDSPLDRLSILAKQRFVDSLVFSENGLGSFRYSELEVLSATEVHQILSLFGAERTTSMIKKVKVLTDSDRAVMRLRPSGDHDGYYCSGRATCSANSANICMSSC